MSGVRKLYLVISALFLASLAGNLLFLRWVDMSEKLRLGLLREQGWLVWAKEGVSPLEVPLLLDKEPNYILGGQMKGVGINLDPYAGKALKQHAYQLLPRSDIMAEPIRAIIVEKGGDRLGAYLVAGESRGVVPVTTNFFVGRDLSYRGVNKVRILHNRAGAKVNWDVSTEVTDFAEKNALLLMLGAAVIEPAKTEPGGENTVVSLEYYGGTTKALQFVLPEQGPGNEQVVKSDIYPGSQFRVGGDFVKLIAALVHSPDAGGVVQTTGIQHDKYRR